MMKSVNIEKPCHEDWNAMTPSQKGAFCDKCSIDVYDFSKISNEKVKSILLENKGKHMCGRFTKNQLAELNYDYSRWENQTNRTFQSKFLYACLIAFGMTLFTGCIEDDQIMGGIGVEHIDTTDPSHYEQAGGDSYEQLAYEKGKLRVAPKDTNKTETTQNYKVGKIKYTPPEETEKANCATEELMVKGEIMIPVEENIVSGDSIVDHINRITIENNANPPDSIENWEYFEMGDIAIDPDYYEHLVDTIRTVDTNATDFEDEPIKRIVPSPKDGNNIISTKNLTVSVFPNPTADVAAIILNVPAVELFNIDLRNPEGRHLRNIYSGILPKGIKRFEIELGAYDSGTFIVSINSASESQTVKVQKVQ
jgi:hypothetical protein